jgi:tRNA(fMet)-specific endonuclease VapC
MENAICLDTDFLIDFLRKKEYALNWVKESEDKFVLATTIINVFELFTGAHYYVKSLDAAAVVKELVSKLKILEFSMAAAEEAGKQYVELEKQGRVIEHRDLFIGIIALKEGFSVKTGNKKHFLRIKGLKVI